MSKKFKKRVKILKIAVVVDEVLDENKKKMLDSVKKALSKEYEVEVLKFGENFMREIKSYDLAFNMSTSGGKDTRQLHVPAVLDLMGIPYTGAPASTHALCMDKSFTKAILEKYGINTAGFFVVHPSESVPDHDLEYPLIVKPVREGSSKGLRKESVVSDIESLKRAVRWIHENFNEAALVEKFIDGKEVTIGLLEEENGLRVFPIIEIDFSSLPEGVEKFYSDRVKNQGYDKYVTYHIPAGLSKSMENTLKDMAKRVFKVLGLRDYARMDVRIKNDKYYVLDVNSLPLLVPGYSDILKMAEADGLSYDDLILKIVQSARRRYGI